MSTPLIALIMDAESTFAMSANFYHTIRRNIPEDSHLYPQSMFFPSGEKPSLAPKQNELQHFVDFDFRE
jgi:hypothetical protein